MRFTELNADDRSAIEKQLGVSYLGYDDGDEVSFFSNGKGYVVEPNDDEGTNEKIISYIESIYGELEDFVEHEDLEMFDPLSVSVENLGADAYTGEYLWSLFDREVARENDIDFEDVADVHRKAYIKEYHSDRSDDLVKALDDADFKTLVEEGALVLPDFTKDSAEYLVDDLDRDVVYLEIAKTITGDWNEKLLGSGYDGEDYRIGGYSVLRKDSDLGFYGLLDQEGIKEIDILVPSDTKYYAKYSFGGDADEFTKEANTEAELSHFDFGVEIYNSGSNTKISILKGEGEEDFGVAQVLSINVSVQPENLSELREALFVAFSEMDKGIREFTLLDGITDPSFNIELHGSNEVLERAVSDMDFAFYKVEGEDGIVRTLPEDIGHGLKNLEGEFMGKIVENLKKENARLRSLVVEGRTTSAPKQRG